MGNVIRGIVAAGGLLLAYNGYVEGAKNAPTPNVPTPVDPTPVVPTPVVPTPIPDGTPTTVKIITPPDETIAPPPSAALLAVSAPIKDVLIGHPQDAIKLARAYHQWALLIARDSTIKTTDEFQQAYIEATQVLFQRHAVAGKYPLNKPVDAVIDSAFEAVGLLDTSTRNVKSGEFNAVAQGAAAAAFDAISYQCFQAFLQSPR